MIPLVLWAYLVITSQGGLTIGPFETEALCNLDRIKAVEDADAKMLSACIPIKSKDLPKA